jgi:hypothetical protein
MTISRSLYSLSVLSARAIQHWSWEIGDPSGEKSLSEPQ